MLLRFLPALFWFVLLTGASVRAADVLPAGRKIIIGGAPSLTPLAEKFSARFVQGRPGIAIEFRPGGSNFAVRSILSGEMHVGLITRGLKEQETQGLDVVAIGHDAIMVLTYPGNTVSNLRLRQIQEIYLGRTTNWRELGGSDKGIVVLTRENTSALHATFIDHVFGQNFKGREQAFVLRASKDKVLRTIKRIEGSLGYGIVRPEEAEAQGVKVMAVDGAVPTPDTIARGAYPLTRPQLIISRGAAPAIAREWIASFSRFVNAAAAVER